MADRLDEIRARADAATPGPWGVWTSMDNTRDILSEAEHPAVPLAGLYGRDGSEHPTAGEDADAEFIAHARSDIPYLLDRLAASEQEAARLRDRLAAILACTTAGATRRPMIASGQGRAFALACLEADALLAGHDDTTEALGATTATEAERATLARLRAERDAANARYAEQVQRLQAAIEQAKEYPCPACGHRLMVACGHDALGATTATEAERAGPDGGNGE